MGRWVYMDDEKNTSAKDLKKMCNRLMTASMKSKIDVNVTFNSRTKELYAPTVYLTFFKDNENFSISLYNFYSIERNIQLINASLLLMKDNTKFQEIKNKIKNCSFD